MTQVSELYEHVIGVDTHAATHSFAVVRAATGALVDQAQFPASPAGVARAADWIARRAPAQRLVAIECVGSYGATLARELLARGERICEVKPPRREQRAMRGKSDPLDALAAARAAIACDKSSLITPRSEGIASALRVLLVARKAIDTRRTADRNTLTALVRTYGLGVDARKSLTDAQVREIASWRTRSSDDAATDTIRAEARRLARAVIIATEDLTMNRAAMERHAREFVPGLLDVPGVGPVVAATILVAWSHRGRLRSEAAFAALAGVAPLPASSGNTTRHRLSRAGDRRLNAALEVVARVRMSYDPDTLAYVERRTAEGRTRREIRRCLKRYIARQIYRQLQALTA